MPHAGNELQAHEDGLFRDALVTELLSWRDWLGQDRVAAGADLSCFAQVEPASPLAAHEAIIGETGEL